ncbi:MAG: hypothetical protein O7C98_06590 [Planctomycetota bacterium]|nr:hypothetical protein [Planctomycetota bacterium]
MGEKLQPGTQVEFLVSGLGYQQGQRGEVVDWVDVEDDGRVLHDVKSRDANDVVVRAFHDTEIGVPSSD